MEALTTRYAAQIQGTLSCYDRILVTGTLIGVCYAQGMAAYLGGHSIRLFDFAKFAGPLRDELRANAQRIAQEQGLEIEFIRSIGAFRKEDRIRHIIEQRGDHPGLVHIFSAMERCSSFEPHRDNSTDRTTLRNKEAKCLHYYFYFIDEVFGLCYLRVPTWAPFRLQFYCNGHNYLAARLKQEGITFTQVDNTFIQIADMNRAQAIADAFPVPQLHQRLNEWAVRYCPVLDRFTDFHPDPYHWSVTQLEYSTDILFHRQQDLRPLYDGLVHTAIHAVKADNIATFLGRKLHPNYQDEVGNSFHTRIEGTCIKHHMGAVGIKMYDKQALVLRIETTVNDVSFFKHYRTVEHRNGSSEVKLASLRKNIYSLLPLRQLLLEVNQRYLAFLSQLQDPTAATAKVEQISEPVVKNQRPYRGFNLFSRQDLDLFVTIVRAEFHIKGFQNANLSRFLKQTGPQVSRLLKRLRLHGLIERASNTYHYYLTDLGQEVVLTALKLRELVVIPSLAGLLPPTVADSCAI